MTNVPTPIRALPTPQNPAPTVDNEPLLRSLLSGGLLTDKIRDAGITAADLPTLTSIAARLAEAMRPAPPVLIAPTLERLFAHYPVTDLSEASHRTRWRDWLDDFADVPADVLEAACRDWRRSPERFAPSPGQLLALAKPYLDAQQVRATYVSRAINILRERAA